jgi:hypothetical protein
MVGRGRTRPPDGDHYSVHHEPLSGSPSGPANVDKTALWIFAVLIAVNQGRELVNTLFTGAVASLTLAAGLASGLGGRDLASRKLDD